MDKQLLNALTIDLEDWYQVANLEHLIPVSSWNTCEDRLRPVTRRLLDLLRGAGVHATFFVLGWNAERHPDLLEQIASEGHELGTHGYSHKLVYSQSPDEFARELGRSIEAVSRVTGSDAMGHRAASFSITGASQWAVDVLADFGIAYDSSIVPARHSRYGVPTAPANPHVIQCKPRDIVEFPISTTRALGRNIPFAGGAYFRFLPYPTVRALVRRANSQGRPVMFYLHPWELDPGQPRMPLDPKRRLRCYYNIENTERKLRKLLTDFRFGRAADVLEQIDVAELPRIRSDSYAVRGGAPRLEVRGLT